jgi:uncharacterized protein (DUF2062 family)
MGVKQVVMFLYLYLCQYFINYPITKSLVGEILQGAAVAALFFVEFLAFETASWFFSRRARQKFEQEHPTP